uniref:SCP domain-containing protein n=2 Tax=Panagrellus redivivus TaxID=6233 RepID=A0A7E4VNU9_PANRE
MFKLAGNVVLEKANYSNVNISDEYAWRRVKKTSELIMDPFNKSMQNAYNEKDTLRMALSPDVTEIGCFDKICNGFEYIACKTGYTIVASTDTPLHTPNLRCKKDADCTLPGYTRCDTALGLCDLDPPDKKVVPPLVCLSLSSPLVTLSKEKCDGVDDTGSEMSGVERESTVNSINSFRAMINNNCTLGLGIPKPASNYRKVKYNCALENKTKFECSSSLTPETFISDDKTWRTGTLKLNNIASRRALLHNSAPIAIQLLISPQTAKVDKDIDKAVFIKLFMSEDVTEVGCYIKVCGNYEYMACKTNHNHTLPYDAPLYTPGQRCNSDADCTLPGYHTCDATLGLCDYKSHYARRMETHDKCADMQNFYMERVAEKCDGYDTGSDIGNLERNIYVYFVNQFRSLINNECDLGKGNVKPISNYRKVKYNCALEERAKFDCP